VSLLDPSDRSVALIVDRFAALVAQAEVQARIDPARTLTEGADSCALRARERLVLRGL